MTRLARIWGEVRFKHPFIFDRSDDRDGALASAIPKVGAPADEATAFTEGHQLRGSASRLS